MADRNEKGQFASGRKKTGGVKKGYESPAKKEFRELMADFSRDSYEAFLRAFCECEPRDQCRIYLEALKFNLPLLQSVALENAKEVANDLTEQLIELSNIESHK